MEQVLVRCLNLLLICVVPLLIDRRAVLPVDEALQEEREDGRLVAQGDVELLSLNLVCLLL